MATTQTRPTTGRAGRPLRRGIDVSALSADRVARYARRQGGSVHLERRGGRTYLVEDRGGRTRTTSSFS